MQTSTLDYREARPQAFLASEARRKTINCAGAAIRYR
jgi:hypothetical protein